MSPQKPDPLVFDPALEEALARLAQKVVRHTQTTDRPVTGIPALTLVRILDQSPQQCYLHQPSVCLTAQGAKRILLGEEEYFYDTHHFLISSMDLPIMAQVTQTPYLGILLKLDLRMVAQLMADSNVPLEDSRQSSRGMAVSNVTFPLIDALDRLVGLLDAPQDIPVLAPLLQRELIYRLLTSEQGARLRQVAGKQSHQIAQAIEWIKGNYSDSLHIDDLAARVCMSVSSFHHHFRAFTAMSPLQYQKKLRLHEARRLMLAEHLDAASSAFRVGYESPSQFNREYSRLFGNSPLRDIKQIHQPRRGR